MAFTGNYIPTSYRVELFKAFHNHRASGGHTFKIALYDETPSFTAATTDYTTSGEVSGTNYVAGGIALTNVEPAEAGLTGVTDWENAVFSNVTLSARGAIVYNTTADDGSNTTEAVLILDFGTLRSVTAKAFTVVFPTPDEINAILRNA